ncbi:hypothetical protein [Limnospira fusiformis]|uniref:hypothetical protein n=1 Tax=Limnospira fusiformis TaxID=54297 RepID=UPI0034E0C480
MPNNYDISENKWFLTYNQYFINEDDTPHGSKRLPDISGSKFVRILFDADQVSTYWKMAGWLKFYAYNDVKQNMMVKREIVWLNEYQIIESPPYSNFYAVFDPLERIKWFTLYFWILTQ